MTEYLMEKPSIASRTIKIEKQSVVISKPQVLLIEMIH